MDNYDGTGAQPPAGWYSDPLKRGYERYWDGSEWSNDQRPAQPAPLPSLPATPVPDPVPTGDPQASGDPAVATPHPAAGGLTAASQPDLRAGSDPTRPLSDEDLSDRLAAPAKRLLAVVLDSVVCNVFGLLATMPVWISLMRRMEPLMGDPANPTMPSQSAIQSIITAHDLFFITMGWLAVSVVYHTVLIGWLGATLGKLAVGIRVVPTSDPGRRGGPGWGTAFVRALAWSLLAQWPWLSYLALLFVASEVLVLVNRKRQTWPDLLARTYVVEKPTASVTQHFNPR